MFRRKSKAAAPSAPEAAAEQLSQLGLGCSPPVPPPTSSPSRRSFAEMSVASTELDSEVADEASLHGRRVWVCRQEERDVSSSTMRVFSVCASEDLAERACAERVAAWRSHGHGLELDWVWETGRDALGQPAAPYAGRGGARRVNVAHEPFEVQGV